ncbi:HK97 family phage prohead protease [Actinoplanes oblitus]|uniref:HK97 family phage prohead protease n=1 Tax=Actinoplanes oblitus TaxID=3040509 RepID=A0ABY8WNF5_9ACTN|nr:HK97 family phage prohead protease [Actinoplanes oblitus]WIM99396.1 HK97 family phage prohead protease [Actinoplanes oblitus]
MSEEMIRYTADLQLRVADENPDEQDSTKGRTLEGIALKYNDPTELGPGVIERVAPGAFEGSQHVVLRDEHARTIGTVDWRDEDDAVRITARVAKTQAGDEALELVRSGAYHALSVGFLPKTGGTQIEPDGMITRTAARLFEVSLTGIPAYENSKILEMRKAGQPATKGNIMPNDEKLATLETEVSQLREMNEDLQRRMATFSVPGSSGPTVLGAQYRSAGEWIKAIANGEDEAIELANQWKNLETRAYNGTTTGNVAPAGVVPPAWVTSTLEFVQRNRVTQEVFTRQALPAQGMSVEYLSGAASTLQIQEQVNQGDVLAFGKLSFDASTAPIKTYGGYTSFSFQAIRRLPVNVVDMAYQELVNQATFRSNAATRAALAALTPTTVARGGNTIANWEAAIINGVSQMASSGIGRPAEFLLVSLDVFQAMAGVRDGSARLLTPTGGSAQLSAGSLNAGALSAEVLGLPVKVDTTLAAGTCLLANSQALITFGDATPTRLTQDDITNLTTEMSVYYEQATAIPFAGSIISITA